MIETLVISNVVSWLAILALGVAVLALSRQIGVLHERIRPVGALSIGQALKVGDAAPLIHAPSLTGGMTRIGHNRPDGKVTLLFFLSPDCPVCKTLLPMVVSMARQEAGWLQLVFASDGAESDHQRYISDFGLDDFGYVLSTEVGMSYQVSKLPYSYLIDANGSIAAHGLINNREHLESLFAAYQAGVDSNRVEEAHAGQVA